MMRWSQFSTEIETMLAAVPGNPAFDDLNAIEVGVIGVLHGPYQHLWRLFAGAGICRQDSAHGNALAVTRLGKINSTGGCIKR